MKYYTSSKTIVALLCFSGATIATANVSGVVNTGVGAVGGITGGVGGQLGQSTSAGGAFGGVAGGTLGSANGRSAFDVTPSARIDAFESIGMRQARLAQAAAVSTNRAAAAAGVDSAVVPLPNEQAASAVLATGFSAETIRASSADERNQLAASIDKRIDASSDALAALKRDSKSLQGEAKDEFKAALKEVNAREKELRSSIKAARKASQEAWTASRTEVAARYEAYEQSVAHAESFAATTAPTVGADAEASVTGATRAPHGETEKQD